DAAQIELERTSITAPFDGVISDLQVSVGDRLRVGDPLMRLQNPDALEIRAQLPTRFARTLNESLSEGANISARIEADGRELPGTLLRVSGQTSAGSGGVDSFIGVESGLLGLRLGSTVRLLLELPEENNVIAVPAEAIYGNDRLYKLDGDRMLMVDIERVGERALPDGRTEVLVRTPELADNEQIVVTKLANAADGLLVAPTLTGPQSKTINAVAEDSTLLGQSP
ncbi:MAG: HlyD family efflux transporter periplasmic adaptor subunit, partial [Gammaproteobacteria bacterium]|nr:HlyD family efflux transporter periplasmic adaptor subunit [Gammaproteobacteria bacterium]